MIDISRLLGGVPGTLRSELLDRYREIAKNYLEHRWEPAELNGGKFAEVAYSIVDGAVRGSYPSSATKPSNFREACKRLEEMPAKAGLVGDRSLRVLIPRILVALYDIRNNRNVGHVGGDVDPNHMDSTAVFSNASWVLAELVRIFHGVPTTEAQAAVNALSERSIPIVWVVPGTEVRRVLQASMSAVDQTVLLLHVRQGWLGDDDLFKAVGYGRMNDYRSKVLEALHKKRMIEYDRVKRRAHLTPLGVARAEELLETALTS